MLRLARERTVGVEYCRAQARCLDVARRPLPNFRPMWEGYPADSSEVVKARVGGGVNMAWLTNTCTVRMSMAFHNAGHPIPQAQHGMTTTYGNDGRRYAFRVAEFNDWLRSVYGLPSASGAGNRSVVAGKKGIIQFAVDGWSDATGHFDMWDGQKVKYSEYFAQAHAVYLWECPPP